MALAALVRAMSGATARRAAFALVLGVLGASLFYGDCLITPAISVLSAVEGLEVAAAGAGRRRPADRHRHPRRAVRRAALRHPPRRAAVRPGHGRLVRRAGRARACRTSSSTPACCWGSRRPTSCRSSPTTRSRRSSRWARSCWRSPAPRPSTPTWATSGGARSGSPWFALVFPALILNYLGQGALILDDPSAVAQPVLPAGAELGAVAAGRAGHRGHGDRLAGGDLRGVLGVAAGRAAGLPAAPHGAAHVHASRAGRSTCPPSTGCCSRACWCSCWSSGRPTSSPPPTASRSPAPCCSPPRCSSCSRPSRGSGPRGSSCSARCRVRRRRAHLPRRQPHQDRRRAAGCRCSSRRSSSR